jgi:hypothetical protein
MVVFFFLLFFSSIESLFINYNKYYNCLYSLSHIVEVLRCSVCLHQCENELCIYVYSFLQVPSSRSSGLREDGKIGTRDTAAGDPAGLRDQV